MASGKRYKKSRRGGKRRRKTLQTVILIGMAALVIAFGVLYFTLKSYVDKTAEDVICNNIFIGAMDVSGMTKKEAADALREQMETDKGRTVTLKLRDENIAVLLKELGYDSPDIDKLTEKAVGYGKKGSVWKRYLQIKKLEDEAYVLKEKYKTGKEETTEVCNTKVAPLLQLPENAHISRNEDGSMNLVDEKEGETIDIDTTVQKITEYLNGDWKHNDFSMDLAVITEKPEIVRADLEGITDELGAYSTDAGGGDRWTNLKTGSEKINDTILMPGEEFSMYNATAPYDAEHGYAEGTAYENGEVVPAYGGGICQVSTTLYNAVIYAELEVVERHPHSMTVDYVEPSRDAAIAGDFMDFRFKNSYDSPIYIFAEIDASNRLRVVIYGKDTRQESRSVEFKSETLSTEDYSVKYKANPKLYFGDIEYTGSPHTGKEARLWKIVYENGAEVSRDVFNTSTYTKSDQVVEIGTAGGSSWAVSALETAIANQDWSEINNAISEGYGNSDDE